MDENESDREFESVSSDDDEKQSSDVSSTRPYLEMIVEHTESFQAWLAKVLKPLCDADPGALAKYVLALIKKDKTEKELRQSMIDQLDVFLQSETKPFVDKLFEALNNKEYLIAKCSEPVQSKNESVGEKAANDATSGGKSDKPVNATLETEPTSSTSGPTATVNSTSITSTGTEGSSKKGSNTLSVTPSALLNAGSTEATSSHNEAIGNKDDSKSRRDRRDDDRDKRRKRSRTERDRRGSRSRSADRNKRSRSPRLERDRERDRDRNDRLRHRPRKSPPPRRYERDVWDRRRSRSPMRNRSASPRNRSRTPPRYRRPFNSSRSRSRSPIVRDRSRSRSRSRSPGKDKKDSLLPLPLAHSEPDMANKDIADKPLVQSVVVRPGVQPSEGSEMKPGYNAAPSVSGVTGNRCRDFDEKGLCMRGELCPFDHGKDPVVLEDIVVPGVGSGGAPGYGGRGIGPGAGPGYTAPLVRPTIMGEYYPDSPSIEPPVGWGPGAPQFRPRHLGFDSVARGRGGLLLRPSAMGPYPVPGQRQLISVPVVGVPPAVPVMGDLRGPHPPMPPMPMHPMRGMHGMRGRGRGGFDHGRLGAKPPRNYTNCSLEVRKIPREQNTIMDLNSHFLRFGKIINIQITYENDPEAALVTFSSPAEAQLAYRSTEAVLNNRFIRVFWHNKEKENEEETEAPNPPHRISVKDRLGAQQDPSDDRRHEHEKILISGNNLTKTVYNNAFLTKKMETPQEKLQAVEAIKKSQELLAAQENLKKLQEQKKQEVLKMSNDLRKRKQTMMEEQIEQQKKLIAKFEVSKDKMKPEEKEQLLNIIKSLQESVEKLKKDLDDTNPKLAKKPALQGPKTKEEAQKEMLDAELDLYNKEQQGGDTIDLQKKVIELRARAKSLGLIGARGRGAYRGAGRGFRARGIIRGRGRLRALRSVDRRPTKIRVTGFPAAKLPDLLAHLSIFGVIRDYESDTTLPMMIVDYDSRKCAEVAMSNGQMFEENKLSMEWVTDNNHDNKAGQAEHSNNGETSNHDDLDNSASIEEDDDELGDILNSEILLTGEEDEEDDEDRSWRR